MIEYRVHYSEVSGSGVIKEINLPEEKFLDWMKNKGMHYFYVSVFRFETDETNGTEKA